jgi:hypothetical protein
MTTLEDKVAFYSNSNFNPEIEAQRFFQSSQEEGRTHMDELAKLKVTVYNRHITDIVIDF